MNELQKKPWNEEVEEAYLKAVVRIVYTCFCDADLWYNDLMEQITLDVKDEGIWKYTISITEMVGISQNI